MVGKQPSTRRGHGRKTAVSVAEEGRQANVENRKGESRAGSPGSASTQGCSQSTVSLQKARTRADSVREPESHTMSSHG